MCVQACVCRVLLHISANGSVLSGSHVRMSTPANTARNQSARIENEREKPQASERAKPRPPDPRAPRPPDVWTLRSLRVCQGGSLHARVSRRPRYPVRYPAAHPGRHTCSRPLSHPRNHSLSQKGRRAYINCSQHHCNTPREMTAMNTAVDRRCNNSAMLVIMPEHPSLTFLQATFTRNIFTIFFSISENRSCIIHCSVI